MRFGAMNFPVKPVIEEIDEFAELGFAYVELAMDPPQAHHSQLESQRERILAHLERGGLGLVCHLPTFVSTADLTASIRHASIGEVLCSMETASRLGAEKAVLHPGMVAGLGRYVPEKVDSHGLAFLEQAVSTAEGLGLPLCLENMMPGYGQGVEADYFATLFERFPSLQMTLDTGHAVIGAPDGGRLRELLQRCGERIGHVHISDNGGARDDHQAPGEGVIDFAALLEALKALRYDSTVTLEVFDRERSRLAASRDWLERLWEVS